MTSPTRVVYTPTSPVTATLVVDGHDVTSILRRFSYDHEAAELPKVFLELNGGLAALPEGIDADAIVHVRETVYEDPADAARRFLEPIDPAELERACLAAMEAGGPTTFGEAALAVLTAYTEGRPQV